MAAQVINKPFEVSPLGNYLYPFGCVGNRAFDIKTVRGPVDKRPEPYALNLSLDGDQSGNRARCDL